MSYRRTWFYLFRNAATDGLTINEIEMHRDESGEWRLPEEIERLARMEPGTDFYETHDDALAALVLLRSREDSA